MSLRLNTYVGDDGAALVADTDFLRRHLRSCSACHEGVDGADRRSASGRVIFASRSSFI
jgi:hypothetical protein